MRKILAILGLLLTLPAYADQGEYHAYDVLAVEYEREYMLLYLQDSVTKKRVQVRVFEHCIINDKQVILFITIRGGKAVFDTSEVCRNLMV